MGSKFWWLYRWKRKGNVEGLRHHHPPTPPKKNPTQNKGKRKRDTGRNPYFLFQCFNPFPSILPWHLDKCLGSLVSLNELGHQCSGLKLRNKYTSTHQHSHSSHWIQIRVETFLFLSLKLPSTILLVKLSRSCSET